MSAEPRPIEDVLKEAKEKLMSLRKEREARPNNDHPDHRVPTEILPHLKELGRINKGMIQQKERMKASIARHEPLIVESETIAFDLKTELDIAIGFIIPKPNAPEPPSPPA